MSTKQVHNSTISRECKYCAEGEPEWSPNAQCWIHRRPTLDKRCTRKIIGPCVESPVETVDTLWFCCKGHMFFLPETPAECPECAALKPKEEWE